MNKENYDMYSVNGTFGSLAQDQYVIADLKLNVFNEPKAFPYRDVQGNTFYLLKFSSLIKHPEYLNTALETNFNSKSDVYLNISVFGIRTEKQLNFIQSRVQKGYLIPSAVGMLKSSISEKGAVQLDLVINTPKTLHTMPHLSKSSEETHHDTNKKSESSDEKLASANTDTSTSVSQDTSAKKDVSAEAQNNQSDNSEKLGSIDAVDRVDNLNEDDMPFENKKPFSNW